MGLDFSEKDFRMVQIEERTVLNGFIVPTVNTQLPKKIEIVIQETLTQDLNMITVLNSAKDFQLNDTEIILTYRGGHTRRKIIFICNYAQNVTIRNCKFILHSETQVNVEGVYNCGQKNTMLDSGADMLSVQACNFAISVTADEFPFENRVCAIENVLANSVSLFGNYIFVQTSGVGAGQKAYGVINTGRYLRCENNNIKANGSHNEGELLEAAHAIGFFNDGQYLIFTGNNCVGEWGGKCVGLENRSQYCTITSNKILATHTMCGRTVLMIGSRNILADNILTGTSRNPRGIEIRGDFNLIKGNYLETLQPADVLKSGCGIWIEGASESPVLRCAITDNIVVHARDFGIFLNNVQESLVRGNLFCKHNETDDFIAILEQNGENNKIETVSRAERFSSYDFYGRIERNREGAIRSLIHE